MYWAHSDPAGRASDSPENQWQSLADHLRNVSRIAECLAQEAAPNQPALHQMASMAGLLHDYGKYTECFQRMICSGHGRCPHAIFGAIAVRQFSMPSEGPMPVVRSIAAHHAGLMDDSELILKTRAGMQSKTTPERCAPDPDGYAVTAKMIWAEAILDLPEIQMALVPAVSQVSQRHQDLLTRMLLSCLVDADRLDAAGRTGEKSSPLRAEERLKQLLNHLDDLHTRAVACGGNSAVLKVREQVQELCREAARGSSRLLSLAVNREP